MPSQDASESKLLARAILKDKNGDYILGQRPGWSKLAALRWALLGGTAEETDLETNPESPELATIIREIKEELNLDLTRIEHTIEFWQAFPFGGYSNHVFLITLEEEIEKLSVPDELANIASFTEKEIEKMIALTKSEDIFPIPFLTFVDEVLNFINKKLKSNLGKKHTKTLAFNHAEILDKYLREKTQENN